MTTSLNGLDIIIEEEYRQLMPELPYTQYKELKESVKTNGQYVAITVVKRGNTYVILDGHHRFRICQELGIMPKIEIKEFPTLLDEKLCVIDSNIERRQLNNFQKAQVGVKRELILKEIAKQNSLSNLKQYSNKNKEREIEGQSKSENETSTSSNEPLGAVADKVARAVGLKTATYKRAKYIIENGTQYQKQILRSGKSEINTIYKQIQNEKTRQELIKNAKENPALELPAQQSCKLLHGDFREKLKHIPDSSIDIIFTDPPYKKQDLPIYKDLAALAARVLKPGGSLILYTGGYEIPEVIDYLRNAGLKYWFYLFVKHTGGLSRLWDKGVTVDGKILLWFVKGDRPRYVEPIRNFIESTPPDKSLHDWSQSTTEAEYMISHLTVENQVVLDPFIGGATTVLAALQLNRKIIGTEIQEDVFIMAKNKVDEFLSSKRRHRPKTEDKNKILAEFIEENNLDDAIKELLSEI